jgi:uncharacterized protein with NAD-binding domain and iron-sulfur cluster
MTPQRKKLIVLGGGAGSLSTVYHLTSQPDWQERYESITLYQMGWRLGGKGASGRGENGRIEEHGLHIWMGWYENAFKMMRAVYGELGRPANAPLATWTDAFHKHDYINLGEEMKGEWTNWPIDFPSNKETPGEGGTLPNVWDAIHESIKGLRRYLRGTLLTRPGDAPGTPPEGDKHPSIFDRIKRIGVLIEEATDIVAAEILIHEAEAAAWHARHTGANDIHQHHRDFIADCMHSIRDRILKHIRERMEHNPEARRAFFIIDTCVTGIAGVVAEGCGHGPHAFDVLDRYDFREFLTKHGARPETVSSSLISAFYQLLFAYRNGDPKTQAVGAGVAIRFIFRMTLTYKGAIFWKMQAGMGDTIFAPIYEVLKKRGVDFKFFHRVRGLEPSDDGKSVARVRVGQQATPTTGGYDPLFDVNGLPCWPSQPFFDQLKEGDELRANTIDLESMWSPWVDRETEVVLEAGTHYDEIVYGISLASLPYLCPKLVDLKPRWRDMLEKLETVRTQAVQLWMTPDLASLGWLVKSAVTDVYPEPLDTWADMSQLIPRECWPQGSEPGTITYFCAPMIGGIPDLSDRDAPAREDDKVYKAAIDWLNANVKILWPMAINPSTGFGFDWNMLIAPPESIGSDRLDAQYWRANIDPSERYVLSVPGSTEYRLRADDPDFDNMFLTGDWTYTGVNAGCVEGTVISGMLTSRAMTGSPTLEEIVGYSTP